MDEYARAAGDFCRVAAFDPARFVAVRTSDNPHTVSPHAICAHVSACHLLRHRRQLERWQA
jgi:hypothetical protein